jgi:hypothetical protein
MRSLGRRTLTQINRAAGTLVLVALNFVVLVFDLRQGADCCDAKCRKWHETDMPR